MIKKPMILWIAVAIVAVTGLIYGITVVQLDMIPAEQDTIPVEQDTIPAERDTIPAEQETIPAEQETIPAEQETIPAEQETIPAERANSISKIYRNLDAGPAIIPDSIAAANNAFSIDFYRLISDNNDNIFFSPISMFTAFSALYEGARENSASEMEHVFGFEPVAKTRAESVLQMISSINREDPHATLDIANSVWVDASIRELYSEIVRDVYLADIEPLTDADTINAWASEKTHGKIPEPVSAISPDAVMMLVNAVYFKGTWVSQFEPEETKPGEFWINPTDSIETDFMNIENRFGYAHMEGVQILEMPYEGDRLSMLLLLPDTWDGIGELEDALSVNLLKEWRQGLVKQEMIVMMPKFTMNTNYDLVEPLKELGMADVFDDRDANLSGISVADRPYISEAFQYAFVNVNEEGTEAAAFTASEVMEESMPILQHYTADHPFLFLIQDNESGTILFMGRVSAPT